MLRHAAEAAQWKLIVDLPSAAQTTATVADSACVTVAKKVLFLSAFMLRFIR